MFEIPASLVRVRKTLIGCVAAGLLLAANGGVATEPETRHVFTEPHMGTLFHITVYAPDRQTAEIAAREAFFRVRELDSIMSDYDPESELIRLARQPAGTPVKVSGDLFKVLKTSREISDLSEGAFDITAAPLVRLWREARVRNALPEETDIAEALKTTGYRNLRLDRCARTVTIRKPGIMLDLGGIAKGYAAKAALEVLREHGLPRAIVAASGDLAIGDAPPGRDGWRIGIASIDAEPSGISRVGTLKNIAVSTSGDTEQFVEIDGVRYSHIVDPKTGIGLTERIGVTVLAPNATQADGLATAISVMGAEKGMALVEALPKVEALIIRLADEEKEAFESGGFSRYSEN